MAARVDRVSHGDSTRAARRGQRRHNLFDSPSVLPAEQAGRTGITVYDAAAGRSPGPGGCSICQRNAPRPGARCLWRPVRSGRGWSVSNRRRPHPRRRGRTDRRGRAAFGLSRRRYRAAGVGVAFSVRSPPCRCGTAFGGAGPPYAGHCVQVPFRTGARLVDSRCGPARGPGGRAAALAPVRRASALVIASPCCCAPGRLLDGAARADGSRAFRNGAIARILIVARLVTAVRSSPSLAGPQPF